MKISFKSRWDTKPGDPSPLVDKILKGKTIKQAARLKGWRWRLRWALAEAVYGLESEIPLCCTVEHSIRILKFNPWLLGYSCREYNRHPNYLHCVFHRYTEHKKLKKTLPTVEQDIANLTRIENTLSQTPPTPPRTTI